MSVPVAAPCRGSSLLSSGTTDVATCRDQSRHAATCRGLSRLNELPRCRQCACLLRPARSDISREFCFDKPALQMAFCAITLDAARRAGKAGTCVALQSIINSQSEIAVVACRDRSRQVVGHKLNDNPPRSTPQRLSPKRKGALASAARAVGRGLSTPTRHQWRTA
jgi:hypothetical protein